MNEFLSFNRIELWHIAGWTMLHYLWLGTLVAAAAVICRLLLRRTSPNIRYAAALCWLMFLAVLPIGVAVWLNQNAVPFQFASAPRLASDGTSGALVDVEEPLANASEAHQGIIELSKSSTELPSRGQFLQENDVAESRMNSAGSPTHSIIGRRALSTTLESCVPYLPWLWIVGTPITFALLAAGVVGTKRLRRASRAIHGPQITEVLARLTGSLRVTRRVAVAVCERIAAPVLVGILRPIILLPPAALTGWTPDEIEMVLLHELAHVRRWDNLVNLVQRIIESLLFFHPAVWLVSTWIRREREACCDALVVTRTNRPHAYAELLIALAAQMPRSVLFHPAASSAMAAGPLRSRIRRILGLQDDPMLISGKTFAIVLVSLLFVAISVLYLPTIGQADEQPAVRIEQAATAATESSEPKERVPESPEAPVPTARDNVDTSDIATRDPETAPLVQEIAALQKRRSELESQMYGMQTDYAVKKAQLVDQPARPNLALQQLTKDFQTQFGALQEQFAAIEKALTEKRKSLAIKADASVELNRGAAGRASDSAKTPGDKDEEFERLLQELYAIGYTKGELKTQLHQLQLDFNAMKRRLEAYAGGSVGPDAASSTGDVDAELLIQKFDALQYRKGELEKHLYQLTLDFGAMERQLENPKAVKDEFEQALHKDPQLQMLREQLRAAKIKKFESDDDRATASLDRHIAQLLKQIDAYRGQRYEQKLQSYQEAMKRYQQSAKDYQVGAAALKDQLSMIDTTFAQKRKTHARNAEATSDPERPPAEELRRGTDDWPAGVAFSSPKEGEISKRAFELLGLKIVAATANELTIARQKGYSSGLKILNLPAGKFTESGPLILVSLGRAPITDFADLDHIITKIGQSRMHSGQSVVELGGVAGKREFKSVVQLHSLEEVKFDDGRLPHPGSTFDESTLPQRNSSSKSIPRLHFPTLEEQKLADLVWKRMQLELEPIGDDDLKRVRALGYDGGVKVANRGDNRTLILTHDILVGLHVWPTTTMKDVAEVLNREDLAELNPLKFYVVSNMPVAEKDDQAIMGDVVRTGRISVSINDGVFGRGPVMTRSQIEAATRAGIGPPPAKATPASDPDLPRYEVPSPEVEAVAPSKSQPANPNPFAAAAPSQRAATNRAVSSAGAAAGKDNLHYDGKTFDEWRDLWRNELSAVTRTQAVKALAAFGRAGYGKEAAKEILDVASNYDYYSYSGDAEEKLEQAVLDGLAPEHRSHELAKYWLPDLAARLEKDSDKWNVWSRILVSRLKTNDPQLIAVLQSLAMSGPAEVRVDALSALLRASVTQDGRLSMDEKTRKLFAGALSGEDPSMTISALFSLLHYPAGAGGGMATSPTLMFQPELVPLLLHDDERVRGEVRGVLRYIDKKDAPQVVRQLLAVLDDNSRKADHLHAIQGLAAMAAQSREAIPALKRVLKRSDDRTLLIAALAAVVRIASGNISLISDGQPIDDAINNGFTDEELSAARMKLGYADSEEFLKFIGALRQALNAVYPRDAQQGIGGGGGFF